MPDMEAALVTSRILHGGGALISSAANPVGKTVSPQTAVSRIVIDCLVLPYSGLVEQGRILQDGVVDMTVGNVQFQLDFQVVHLPPAFIAYFQSLARLSLPYFAFAASATSAGV